jgi:hypothetical protein
MKASNKYWKRKKTRLAFETDKLQLAILIICEGEKTEPEYFKSFRITTREVEIVGLGKDPKTIVEYANQRKKDGDYDQVWCVFDKDDMKKGRFDTAMKKANAHDIKIAYSNEAFELWYLLHFEYLDSAITRKQYIKKLDKLLGVKYRKNDPDMYEKLLDKQDQAIKRSKKLLKQYPDNNPFKNNPSTTVHQLVSVLNKYIK